MSQTSKMVVEKWVPELSGPGAGASCSAVVAIGGWPRVHRWWCPGTTTSPCPCPCPWWYVPGRSTAQCRLPQPQPDRQRSGGYLKSVVETVMQRVEWRSEKQLSSPSSGKTKWVRKIK